MTPERSRRQLAKEHDAARSEVERWRKHGSGICSAHLVPDPDCATCIQPVKVAPEWVDIAQKEKRRAESAERERDEARAEAEHWKETALKDVPEGVRWLFDSGKKAGRDRKGSEERETVVPVDLEDAVGLFTKEQIRILKTLRRGPAPSVKALARSLRRQLTHVSAETRDLEVLGLVSKRRRGEYITVSLEDGIEGVLIRLGPAPEEDFARAIREWRARQIYCKNPQPCAEHQHEIPAAPGSPPRPPFTGPCSARVRFDDELLRNVKAALPKLERLLADCDHHWAGEDAFYRFYHHSAKVYSLQSWTLRVAAALEALLPAPLREVRTRNPPLLNAWFTRIVEAGTGKEFRLEHNRRWLHETRPMVEAFFHARQFLAMAVKYGKALDKAPDGLPSGWAALLYLYDMR